MTKTIIITGATRGIGRACALTLLEDGCNIALNYHADEANARVTMEACNKFADQVLTSKPIFPKGTILTG